MDHTVTVRDARSRFAQLVDRAGSGGATVITRSGTPVAAVVPMDDYNALEDAIDAYFARKAEQVAQSEEGQPTHTLSQVVADIFGEQAQEPGA